MEDSGLNRLIDKVDSKETFLEFLRTLTSDWDTHEAEWENGTIPDFLSACCSWAEATCALAGKRYEEHWHEGHGDIHRRCAEACADWMEECNEGFSSPSDEDQPIQVTLGSRWPNRAARWPPTGQATHKSVPRSRTTATVK